MNAYFDGMRRYADFTGRATRSQFWFFMLGYLILSIVGVFIDAASSSGEPSGIVTSLIGLAHILPTWAVSARRLHDIDRSGWWALISLLPIVGAIALIVFYCTASQPGPNRYGVPSAAPPPGTSDQNSYRQPDFTGFAPSAQPSSTSTAQPLAPVLAINTPSSDEGALIERLERLAALRASGAIDDVEFAQMKASALTRHQPNTGMPS